MAGVSDLESRSILTAALVTLFGTAAVLLLTGPSLSASQPQIVDGDFALDRGPLLSTADSCSTDTDCAQTTCHDGNYYVDTDGDRECTTDPDGNQVCAGYDKSYADATICGGRYDYNCDSTGCDGYKAACEDDCSANTGCDTYDFCSDDSDSDDSDSTNDGSTTTRTDQCQSLTKTCDGAGQIVQCQDTDSDPCTDGFVTIATCDGSCENAQCVAPEPTDPVPNETTPDDPAELTEPVEPEPAPTVTDRVVQALQTVWTTLTEWL